MKYSMCLSVACSQASSTAVNEDKSDDVGFAGADASAPGIPFIPVSRGSSEASSKVLHQVICFVWGIWSVFLFLEA